MKKILIADDHAVVRQGLQQIIKDSGDMVVVGEATTAVDVITKVRELQPDVLILDLTLPGKSGLDILHELKNEKINVGVLVLSMHGEELFAVRTLRAGAMGYLSKGTAPEEILDALRSIASGKPFISGKTAELLGRTVSRRHGKLPHELLSDREHEVFLLLASGNTLTEIANKLSVNVKTISTYKKRIMQKMGLHAVSELTQYALHHGLLKGTGR